MSKTLTPRAPLRKASASRLTGPARAPPATSIKRNRRSRRDVTKISDHGCAQRNPRHASLRLGLAFRVTRNHDARRACSRPGRAEHANPFVHPPTELVRFHEAVDPHRAKEVTDPQPDLPVRHFDSLSKGKRRRKRPPVGSAQHTRQDVHESREAIPLV